MATEADRMAQCRRDFAEAMRLGCSIPDLRARRRELRTRARSEVQNRTDDMVDGDHAPAVEFLRFDAPWMMRD